MVKNKMISRRGLTLLELLIVVLVAGALAVIIVPRIGRSATNAKIKACKANVDAINTQIELYRVKTDNWPAALTEVMENTDYFRDDPPECPFGTAYILGPNYRVTKHNH
jgi:prepilin-type N-terminal cleavage/methylation domain-containing protein